MDDLVLVPWEQNRQNAPEGLRVEVYSADEGDPQNLDEVTFYVLPYWRSRGPELLERMPKLKVAQTLTAGYEHVLDLLPSGVTLCSGRGLHDSSTAELALALMLSAQRDLARWAYDQREHRWEPDRDRSLADSRVLILGYGSIGQAIEKRVVACEAEVVRVASRPRPDQDVYGIADLHTLLPTVDIVVLVTPHTPQTEGLMGAAELALLRDDALVVNVGRGPVLDTAALLAENGRVRAALDVTDPEPLPAAHPLWDAPGVTITPHIAGGAASFYPRARRFVDEQLARWARGEPLANVVREG